MGSIYAKDVIHGAQAWIGYHEGDNNWNTFANILDGCKYFDPQYKQNIPWCAIFCDCMCLLEALPKDRDDEAKKYDAQYVLYQPSYNNYSAGAREFAGYFKDAGEWYTSDPKIGDMIFFDFGNGIAHVGIVGREHKLIHACRRGNVLISINAYIEVLSLGGLLGKNSVMCEDFQIPDPYERVFSVIYLLCHTLFLPSYEWPERSF